VTGQAWLPQGVDAHKPTDARVHDYALGGKDNYAVDRRYAQKLVAVLPNIGRPAVENGKFARRAIRYLLSTGVRQFLEIGCGLPRRANVHDVAGPESRVVYVDYDPVAVTHYEAVLSGNRSAAVIQADATRPTEILSHPVAGRLIDFEQPVALLVTYLFQLIPDEADPARIMREFRAALAPGSHLVLSHVTQEEMAEADVEAIAEVCEELREPVRLRSREEVGRLFDGFELVEPGLVDAPEWRPDRPYRTPTGWLLAGVGRKP
jgi:SAM-dependent methyltransferase